MIVRDVRSRAVVAHFRAHGSAISALEFDHAGKLLVTASVSGHTLNVFSIREGAPGGPISKEQQVGGKVGKCFTFVLVFIFLPIFQRLIQGNVVHLYKLHRGVTSAVSTAHPFVCT